MLSNHHFIRSKTWGYFIPAFYSEESLNLKKKNLPPQSRDTWVIWGYFMVWSVLSFLLTRVCTSYMQTINPLPIPTSPWKVTTGPVPFSWCPEKSPVHHKITQKNINTLTRKQRRETRKLKMQISGLWEKVWVPRKNLQTQPRAQTQSLFDAKQLF